MKGRFGITLFICVTLLGGCAAGGVGRFKPEEYNIECLEVRAIKMNPRRDLDDTIYFDYREIGVGEGSFYKVGKSYLVWSLKSHPHYLILYKEKIEGGFRQPIECSK